MTGKIPPRKPRDNLRQAQSRLLGLSPCELRLTENAMRRRRDSGKTVGLRRGDTCHYQWPVMNQRESSLSRPLRWFSFGLKQASAVEWKTWRVWQIPLTNLWGKQLNLKLKFGFAWKSQMKKWRKKEKTLRPPVSDCCDQYKKAQMLSGESRVENYHKLSVYWSPRYFLTESGVQIEPENEKPTV